MRTWFSRWRGRPEAAEYTPLENRQKNLAALAKGAFVAVVLALLVLLVFVFALRINGTTTFNMITSWSQTGGQRPGLIPRPPKVSKLITLKCPTAKQSKLSTCPNKASSSPSPASSPISSLPITSPEFSAPSCPEYFRWIYEDLRPWNSTGITRETVESAKRFASFRLVVLGGRVYVEIYWGAFQTRDIFTLWGILQLVNQYPGRVPDLDLMFECGDLPQVKAADYRASPPPPPLFGYCNDDTTVDILFPDWSFWGWAEVNIKPWETLMEEMEEENGRVKWKDRRPYAYWKGNPTVSDARVDLMKCNVSNGTDWNTRLYAQNWNQEIARGFRNSNLAKQCIDRYKIYVEGQAWSVSKKYIMGCNSPALFVSTHFYEFFSRALIPAYHYWPINETHKCESIKFAVDWGNKHQSKAQAMGKVGSKFVEEELKMDFVYDYMLHLLIQYSKLLRYKPTIPANANEICLESMACTAQGTVKAFMLESMAKRTREDPPCEMPPPYTPEELRDLLAKQRDSTRKVERMEEKARRKKWHWF